MKRPETTYKEGEGIRDMADIVSKVTPTPQPEDNQAHINAIKEIAAAYTEEEAKIVIGELVKTHPFVIFQGVANEFLKMQGTLNGIASIFVPEDKL